MKSFLVFIFVVAFFSVALFAQTKPNEKTEVNAYQLPNTLDAISQEITKIAKSVENLNQRMKGFSETFSSNQGLRLTDRQQKLLIAFEFLNRAEQRLATLQKLKIDLTEKQATIKVRVSRIDERARPEEIDRDIAVRGSTNAEELRAMRRQSLYKEKTDLNLMLVEIQSTLNETNAEIRQTDMFLKSIRQRLFPEIEKEISDL